MKGLEKVRSRGRRTRKNYSADSCMETIPQQRTSWSKKKSLRGGRLWPSDEKIIMI